MCLLQLPTFPINTLTNFVCALHISRPHSPEHRCTITLIQRPGGQQAKGYLRTGEMEEKANAGVSRELIDGGVGR